MRFQILLDRSGRVLTRRLRTWMIKTALSTATRVDIGRFCVYAEAPPSRELLASVRAALQLVERIDPRRFNRLRLDVPNLLLVRVGGGVIYSDLRTAALEHRVIEELSTPELAASLVEIGARARIANAPFAGALTPAHRPRIWRRAIIEQIAFFRRLPRGEFTGVEERIRALHQSIPSMEGRKPRYAH